MTDWASFHMAKNHQARPRERLSAYLRQMYPGVGRDKRLASDLQISPRAARNLFEDHWPGDDTFAAILRRFGDDLWRVVCAPEIAPVLAELTEREAHLARELEAARIRRREVQGLVEGRSYRLAELEEPQGPLNLDLFEGRAQ
jgi:hypothetical protein